MSARTRASVSPRQSPSSAILASISREGEAAPIASFAPLFFMVMLLSFGDLRLDAPLRSPPDTGALA